MQAVDYSKPVTPAGYACSRCGATNCKLWRQYQTFASHIELLCVTCAGTDQGVDVSDVDEKGRTTSRDFGFRTDSIGWLVPAVPTEDGETYWGYTSVPQAGCDWWHGLPNYGNLEGVL
jgi:hypothetical protein